MEMLKGSSRLSFSFPFSLHFIPLSFSFFYPCLYLSYNCFFKKHLVFVELLIGEEDDDRQRDDRQREYHRVGGVAVGAEIIGVRNKDLIDDIVQRADQEGDDAWDRVFTHELSDAFIFEK